MSVEDSTPSTETIDTIPEVGTSENSGASPMADLIESQSVDDSPIPLAPEDVAAAQKTAATAQAATQTATASDEINAIGQQYGLDLSRFKDVESAQAAADLIFGQYANLGDGEDEGSLFDFGQPTTAETTTQTPAAPVDLLAGIDEATTDPALLKTLKAMAAQNAETHKRLNDADTRQKQQAAQQQQAIMKQIDDRADSHLSKVNAAVFGEPGKRTPYQRTQAKVMLSMVKQVINGMAKANVKNSPPIETIVEGVLRHTGQMGKPSTAAPANKPFSLPPKQPAASAPVSQANMWVSKANDPYGSFDDPKVRALFRAALQ